MVIAVAVLKGVDFDLSLREAFQQYAGGIHLGCCDVVPDHLSGAVRYGGQDEALGLVFRLGDDYLQILLRSLLLQSNSPIIRLSPKIQLADILRYKANFTDIGYRNYGQK